MKSCKRRTFRRPWIIMGTTQRAVCVLTVGLLLSGIPCADGVDSSCEANTSQDLPPKLTCLFSEDLAKSKYNFIVQRYDKDQSIPTPELIVLECQWLVDNDKPDCKWADGYAFDGNISHQIVIELRNRTQAMEARYLCQVAHSSSGEKKMCELTSYTEGTTQTSLTLSSNTSRMPSVFNTSHQTEAGQDDDVIPIPVLSATLTAYVSWNMAAAVFACCWWRRRKQRKTVENTQQLECTGLMGGANDNSDVTANGINYENVNDGTSTTPNFTSSNK